MNHQQLFEKMIAKYQKGAEEHNNDLLDKSLMELVVDAQEEAIDMCYYLEVVINKLNKIIKLKNEL